MSEPNGKPWAVATPMTRASAWLSRLQSSEELGLVVVALLVGLGGGFGAIAFRWLISSFQSFFFGTLGEWLSFMGRYYVILAPALGGLIVGPMVYYLAREAKGHGVPEVMEAAALRGGRIRPIVVVVKSLASSVTIGSGGSVGREGPIVQIGSAIGSTIGQALHLSEDRVKNLVACGAAAGIAATFNTPIAGAIFAIEIIAAEFGAIQFTTIVISSVTASVVGRIFFGDVPAFVVPAYSAAGAWELPFYVLLGLLAAVVGFGFSRILYRFEDLFGAWHFPEPLKTPVGGLLLGVMGLAIPQLFGVGYEAIEGALRSELLLGTVLLLTFTKILATSLTIGAGGSGGVFAPSLYVGAMLGAAFGLIIHRWLPQGTAVPGAYALVGMAALFAATGHAPVTAILIVFEMTQDYKIILPLMLATVVSTLVSERLGSDSIYTLKLARRGIHLGGGRDRDVLQGVTVGEAMSRDFETVGDAWPVARLEDKFEKTHHHGFPVVNEAGQLCGIVSMQDLEQVLKRQDGDSLTVRDIATSRPVMAYVDEPVGTALERMAMRDLGRLPVVDRRDPETIVGLLRRQDVIRAYNLALLKRSPAQKLLQPRRLKQVPDTEFAEVDVAAGSRADGRKVSEVRLPEQSVLVAIHRGDQVLIPRGNVVLQAGDRVLGLVKPHRMEEFMEGFGPQAVPVRPGRPTPT